MGGLLQYSGISTKIRAMHKYLLTEQDFRELSVLSSVPDVVAYLKRIPTYAQLFAGLDELHLHRGDIEQCLSGAIYLDFEKLYKFADMQQRRFLDMLFRSYVVRVIKQCVEYVLEQTSCAPALVDLHPFFTAHSGLNITALSGCTTMDGLIAALAGTGYEQPLKTVHSATALTRFDYEMALDLYTFRLFWKNIDRYLTGDDQKMIRQNVGSEMDLLNIQWIYRCKRYFRFEASAVYALLIPIHYRLSEKELRLMTEVQSVEELSAIVAETYYGAKLPVNTDTPVRHLDLERLHYEVLNHLHSMNSRSHPYSVAVLYSYIYRKNMELRRVTSLLESIRYSLDPTGVYQNIM